MDRRNALRVMAGTGLGAVLPTSLLAAADTQVQPNILFIMTDDHDEDAISAYGGSLIETPRIDQIAEEGMRFANCYVTNSLCAPSRATILTGKYSHKNGIRKNTFGTHPNFDGTQTTVQQLLQQAGYYTGMVGKWHLGSTPMNFDYWIHLPGQGRYRDPQFYEKGTDSLQTIQGYVTDVITDLTIDTIERARQQERPFFIMSHHKASHAPFTPANRHRFYYNDRKAPLPETIYDNYEGKSRTAHDYSRWGSNNENRREQYYDFMNPYLETVVGIDENVGRLLDYIDANGLKRDTVVIYTTDNGYFLGDHGYLDKRIMYEDALQIPLLVRYPREVPAGTVNTDMVLNLDFPETFLDYAGAAIPEEMQGRSLRPLLRGDPQSDWRTSMYYHFYEVDGPGTVEKHYGVRTERYKLIYFYTLADDQNPWELYDLQKDPHEMENLYGTEAYRDVQKELKRELQRLRTKYDDQTGQPLDQVGTSLEETPEQPDQIELHQNYPNPFNPETKISFRLKQRESVRIDIIDPGGRIVGTPVRETKGAGTHTIRYDADGLTSGIYFYRLRTAKGDQQIKKMLLIR